MYLFRNILKFVIVLLFWQALSAFTCKAQDIPAKDSLLNEFKSAKNDTSKIKILYKLRDLLFFYNLPKSLEYNKEALALSERINDKNGIITGYIYISGFYGKNGNFKYELDYLNKIARIVEESNAPSQVIYLYDNYCSYYRCIGNYSTAMDYSNKALQLSEEKSDSPLISLTIKSRAAIYMAIADYSTSLNYFFEALKIDERHNDPFQMSSDYFNIGFLFSVEHNNNKAIDYYTKAYEIAKEKNSTMMISADRTELGDIYMSEKEWDKALNCFQQSKVLYSSMDDTADICRNEHNIAMIYCKQRLFDKAIQSALSALQMVQGTKDKISLSNSYECLGNIYMDQKNYTKAINYFNSSLNIFNSIGQKNNLSTVYQDLAKCYGALNDYQSAYRYAAENIQLNDSLFKEESIKKTVEMGEVYNSEKREKEIALLTKDKKMHQLETQKHALFEYALLASLLLICIVFIFIYRNYTISQSLKLQKLRSEIAIDLHDEVGSTLSSIKMYSDHARQHSTGPTPTLDRIIKYLDKTLESMDDIVWNINPENENFEKIMLRMRMLTSELLEVKNIDFEFNVDASLFDLKLSMVKRKNIYLIFKEAINNMMKYSEATYADFFITNENNHFKMIIKDNGKGFDISHPSRGNGINNMKNRANEIQAQIAIESEPGKGTTVELLIM